MKSIVRWLPALILMAVIFALSSTPSQDLPSFGVWDTLVKKGGHFTGYAMLALACLFGYSKGEGEKGGRPYILAFALTLLYALSDEFHQCFVPGRHPSWVDAFLIDGAGAALALWGARWVRSVPRAGR